MKKKDSVLQIRLPLETREDFLQFCRDNNTPAGELLRGFISSCLEGLNKSRESNNQDWVEELNSIDSYIDIDQNMDEYDYFLAMVEANRFIDTDDQSELIRKMTVRYEKKLLHEYFFPFLEFFLLDVDLKRKDLYCEYELIKNKKGLYDFEATFFKRSTKEPLGVKLHCYYGDKEFLYDCIKIEGNEIIKSKASTSNAIVDEVLRVSR